MEEKKKFPFGYLLISALMLLVGGCFLAFRAMFSALAITFAIIVIIFALIVLVQTLLDTKRGFVFACKIVASFGGVACGVVTLILNEQAVNIIANILYLLLIMDGSFKLGRAFSSGKFHTVKFWVTVVLSATLIVSAFLMTKFSPEVYDPTTNESIVCATLSGILIILDGLLNLLYAFFRKGFYAPIENANEPSSPDGNETVVEDPKAPILESSFEPEIVPEAPIVESPDAPETTPEVPITETPEDKPETTVEKPDRVTTETPVETPEAPVIEPEAPVEKPDAPLVETPEEKPEATDDLL